jgi:hypothetical protein
MQTSYNETGSRHHFSASARSFDARQDGAKESPVQTPLASPSNIRRAFIESFQVLGWSALDLLIEDLERDGLFIGKCSLEEIDNGLRRIFGTDVTEIMMNRITLRLIQLESGSA